MILSVVIELFLMIKKMQNHSSGDMLETVAGNKTTVVHGDQTFVIEHGNMTTDISNGRLSLIADDFIELQVGQSRIRLEPNQAIIQAKTIEFKGAASASKSSNSTVLKSSNPTISKSSNSSISKSSNLTVSTPSNPSVSKPSNLPAELCFPGGCVPVESVSENVVAQAETQTLIGEVKEAFNAVHFTAVNVEAAALSGISGASYDQTMLQPLH